jgi:hypothetical protein
VNGWHGWAAAAVFAGTYALIASERIPRVTVALGRRRGLPVAALLRPRPRPTRGSYEDGRRRVYGPAGRPVVRLAPGPQTVER